MTPARSLLLAVIVPAFGRIDSRQDVEAGPYVDSVPVRILF